MAAAGLQKVGRVPDDGLGAVIEALRDPDIRVRTTIASVLGRLEPVPPSAIPYLVENTAPAGDDALRLAAAIALRSAGSAVPETIMVNLLKDANLRVRLVGASAILANDAGQEDAGIVVREAMADKNPRVRELALTLIEPLGPGIASFADILQSARAEETDGTILERIERMLGTRAEPLVPLPAN